MDEIENGDAFLDLKKLPTSKSPHRYTKDELLDIKERPYSKQRPSCLSEKKKKKKNDSDCVWDPEKWHASLPSLGTELTSGKSEERDRIRSTFSSAQNSKPTRVSERRGLRCRSQSRDKALEVAAGDSCS